MLGIAVVILCLILLVSLGACLFLALQAADLKHAMSMKKLKDRLLPAGMLSQQDTCAHESVVRIVRDHFLVGTQDGEWSVPNGPEVFAILKTMQMKFAPEQNLIVAQLLAQMRLAVAFHDAAAKPPRTQFFEPSLN